MYDPWSRGDLRGKLIDREGHAAVGSGVDTLPIIWQSIRHDRSIFMSPDKQGLGGNADFPAHAFQQSHHLAVRFQRFTHRVRRIEEDEVEPCLVAFGETNVASGCLMDACFGADS